MRRERRGIALLSVLWVVTATSVIAGAMLLESRDAVGAARNRASITRTSWRASGCAATLVAYLNEGLRGISRRDTLWATLDVLMRDRRSGSGCVERVRPAGLVADVNAADETQLRALLRHAGLRPFQSDSIADAILDWRDDDDTPRPWGAERDWYAAHRGFAPRNGPFAAAAELLRVRGVSPEMRLDTLLGTDAGRLVMSRAPLAVLASLPGASDEVIERLAAHRASGDGRLAWVQLSSEVSAAAGADLMRSLLVLQARTTLEPDAWLVEIQAVEGQPAVIATLELRLERWGDAVRVVRQRSW